MASSITRDKLFTYRHLGREIIIVCVHWYASYTLSYQDLGEMMAERGIAPAYTTALR